MNTPLSTTHLLLLLSCIVYLSACGDSSEQNTPATQTTSSSTNNTGDTNNTTSGTTNNTGETTSATNGTTSATNGTNGDTTTPAPRNVQLIRSSPFPRLVLELDAVPGTEPSPAVRANIAALFESLLDKPAGISWTEDETIPSRGDDYAWTDEDLNQLALMSNLEVPEDTITIHVVFVNGRLATDDENKRVLGLAWNFTHLVIFNDTVQDLCERAAPPLANQQQFCDSAFTSVMTHEIGHLIGLVDNGLPMIEPHRDLEHGRHDSNEDCIMYWTFAGPQVFDNLASLFLGGSTEGPGFGDQCLQDIAAVRD